MVLVFTTSNILLPTLIFLDRSVLIAHSRFGRYEFSAYFDIDMLGDDVIPPYFASILVR